ncbi:MAG: hypothetical protein ACE5EE_01170 [Fidelibacterota bacterium]
MNNGFGQLVLFIILLILVIGGPLYFKNQQIRQEQEERAKLEALQAEQDRHQAIEDAIIKYTLKHDGNPATASMTITLSGSGLDQDKDELTFRWEQIKGKEVKIDNPTAAKTSFEAGPGEYTFRLIVTDPYGEMATTEQTYRITAEPNTPPEAAIGE